MTGIGTASEVNQKVMGVEPLLDTRRIEQSESINGTVSTKVSDRNVVGVTKASQPQIEVFVTLDQFPEMA